MPTPILSALLFLVTVLIDGYAFILILRLLFAFAGFNYFDPLIRFTIQVTDPLVKPVRQWIPTVRHIELASLVLILLLLSIKFTITASLQGNFPNLLGVMVLSIADCSSMLIMAFKVAIILQILLSWLQPQSPFNRVLYQFTYPLMRPLQRLIPPIAGFDISPIPALISLQLATILLVNPLLQFGSGVAFG